MALVSCILYPDSLFLVIEAVIIFLLAAQFDTDLIGQADGNFADLFHPALAHAILARAGVGGDACLMIVDGDFAEAQWPRHFQFKIARQR